MIVSNSTVFLVTAIGFIGNSEYEFSADNRLHVLIFHPFLILNSKHFADFNQGSGGTTEVDNFALNGCNVRLQICHMYLGGDLGGDLGG